MIKNANRLPCGGQILKEEWEGGGGGGGGGGGAGGGGGRLGRPFGFRVDSVD